jgi:hypothetical protein
MSIHSLILENKRSANVLFKSTFFKSSLKLALRVTLVMSLFGNFSALAANSLSFKAMCNNAVKSSNNFHKSEVIELIKKKHTTHQNSIATCCDSILSADWTKLLEQYGQEIRYLKGVEDKDPYTLGENEISHFGDELKKGQDYNFELPLFLGRVKTIDKDIHLQNSDKTVNERIDLLFPHDGFLFVGAGSHSDVFIKRFPTPSFQELKKVYTDINDLKQKYTDDGQLLEHRYITLESFLRGAWIREHAKKVLKFRKMDADGGSTEAEQRHIRKDLVLGGVLEDCAKKFRYFEANGPYPKDLIRIASYDAIHSKIHEIENGVLTQELIHGDSAFSISSYVWDFFKKKDPNAETYLKKLGFKDATDALHKLKALQAFYYEIHFPIIAFEEKNDLPISANYILNPKYTDGGNPLLPVGADFGHGQNAIWDHTKKIWVIVDY